MPLTKGFVRFAATDSKKHLVRLQFKCRQ